VVSGGAHPTLWFKTFAMDYTPADLYTPIYGRLEWAISPLDSAKNHL
jgi:hypothetical protein